ncbi:MAG: methyl-accepting chemotaxis protein [Cocleimonas sp.]
MLNKLSINVRMIAFIVLPAIFFMIIGYFALEGLGKDHTALEANDANLRSVVASADVNYNVAKHYTQLLSNLNAGYIFWTAGTGRTEKGIEEIKKSFSTFNKTLTVDEKSDAEIQQLLAQQERLLHSYAKVSLLFSEAEDKGALGSYVLKEMFPLANALATSMNKIKESKYISTTAGNAAAISNSTKITNEVLMYIFGGILATMLFGNLIMRSITMPTNKLTKVVHRLAEGEFDARVEVKGNDEFSRLGSAFNGLLDDRAVTLKTIDNENQELNQSIFMLLQAVAELSERNLTIRAEVTEDATGPVADAINLLAEETSSTLIQVRGVATEVNNASQKVNSHLMAVNKLAMKGQEHAIDTADQMNKMLERLDTIADSAAATNEIASTTSISTKKAHDSVSDSLAGMSDIRETVQETGKRIKQLGERSQEISHVIDIINTIAERTTVLALNASMQAVAAGDAGRGFSVIAEEIQRLAESSRDSTEQISTLVRNIQQETNTTISTMDKTIEQVVDGSTKAEDAAEQMKEVLKTTSELVQSVDEIATASREQAGISKDLKHKAESILKSTQSTGQELLSLTGLSRNMADYAQQLVKSVNVFKLDKNKSV